MTASGMLTRHMTRLLAALIAISLMATGCSADGPQAAAADGADNAQTAAAETRATGATAAETGGDDGSFQNVILLIGDGMGPQHVALGRLVKRKPLAFEDWPVHVQIETRPDPIGGTAPTDSAAAGTAIATGRRTRNGRIAMDANGRPLTSIAREFQRNGARIGLVATKKLTDATPAAFLAQVDSRGKEVDIASQIIARRPDVLLGGGRSRIGQAMMPPTEVAAIPVDISPEERILLVRKAASALGYNYVQTNEELAALDAAKTERLMGLFMATHMSMVVNRASDTSEPTLAQMTEAALAVLGRDEKPFFLMVEGSQIDSAGHNNNAWQLAGEMIGFDEAVDAVIKWLDDNEGWDNTLVIVVADHETGGLTVRDVELEKFTPNSLATITRWNTGGHTNTKVPLYARGAGHQAARGARHLTDLYQIMSKSSVLTGPAPAPERQPESVPAAR